jgi:hypothetical protein
MKGLSRSVNLGLGLFQGSTQILGRKWSWPISMPRPGPGKEVVVAHFKVPPRYREVVMAYFKVPPRHWEGSGRGLFQCSAQALRRKWSWSISRFHPGTGKEVVMAFFLHYPRIRMDGLRETTKNLSLSNRFLGRDSNWKPPGTSQKRYLLRQVARC